MKTENILFKSMLMHTHMGIQVVRLFSSVSPQVFGQRGAVSKSTGAPRELHGSIFYSGMDALQYAYACGWSLKGQHILTSVERPLDTL